MQRLCVMCFHLMCEVWQDNWKWFPCLTELSYTSIPCWHAAQLFAWAPAEQIHLKTDLGRKSFSQIHFSISQWLSWAVPALCTHHRARNITIIHHDYTPHTQQGREPWWWGSICCWGGTCSTSGGQRAEGGIVSRLSFVPRFSTGYF